jgi:hypothetical protein
MAILSKQFMIILLSCCCIFQFLLAQSSNSTIKADLNVLQPIYTINDSLPAGVKTVFEEVEGSKIEIQNMPAYKSQDTMGECRAFSLRTVLQKYICDQYKKRIPDCKNPPPEYDVSSFGLMEYTHAEKDKEKTFNPFGEEFNSMYKTLQAVGENNGLMLLDSCNPFSQLVNSFTTNGVPSEADLAKYDKFVGKIKKMYSDEKLKNTEAGIANCLDCLDEINRNTGLGASVDQLKAALKKETFGQFMYALFYDSLDQTKCKRKNLPALYDVKFYPDDKTNATPSDIKNKIIEGLKNNPPSPVLTPSVCLKWIDKNKYKCDPNSGHSMVVAGYKKVCEVKNNSNCKDLFKIHNSWGEPWQKLNNDGWVDADIYTNNFKKSDYTTGRIGSATVLWIE